MARQQRIGWTMFLLLLASVAHAQGSAPLDLSGANWIWAAAEPAGESLAFRRNFDLGAPAVFGRIVITAVPGYELYLNGVRLGGDSDWMEPETFDVAQRLVAGRNTLAVKVPRGGPNPGLLLAFRGVDGDGRVVDLRSDAAWRMASDPAAGWEQIASDDAGWSTAAVKGVYGDPPWGRLTRMSQAETARAMAEVRIELAPDAPGHPAASVFAGDYVASDSAPRYRDFVGVDRATGRFTIGPQRKPMLFVRYRQRGGVTTFESLDFGLLESDLELMTNNGLDLALDGFGWNDLLNDDGTWRAVDAQPLGAGLPQFEYRYQILEHLLNRIQAHGRHAIALLDYRQALPAALLPETYRDKVLLSQTIWQGVGTGQAKIARYFADRSVLVGYALATDALPPLPAVDEPLMHDAYAEFLSRRHGSIEALRAAWGRSGYGSFREVPLPSGDADDPSAVDYRAMIEDLTVTRLNQWVDQLRAADPHHVFAVGLAAPTCPPAAAAQLRFDLLGTFALSPAPSGELEWMPGYGQVLAPVNGYRARSDGAIAGLLGGRYGGGQRGGHAARMVRQEWAELAGSGAAGMIAAPPWDDLVRRGAAGSIDIVSLTSLGSLVNASQADFSPVAPEVLLLGDEACTDARDELAVQRVAESLDREHFVYDILPPSALLGGDPSAAWLDDYRVVIVPSLRRVVDQGLWDRLRSWVQNGAEPRLLVLGRWAETNAYGRPGGLPPALSELTGGARPADGTGRVLMLGRPLSPLPTGKRLDWLLGAPAGLSLGADGEVVGWLQPQAATGEGTPALVRRQVGSGAVLLAGFDLGAAEATILPAGWSAAVGELLRLALAEVGVTAAYAAPANVDTAVSTDGRTILTRERLGQSAEVIWAADAQADQPVWSTATLALDPTGRLTVRLPLAPYQVTPLQAVGALAGLGEGQAASIRVGHREGLPLTIDAEGPAELRVRLWLDPNRSYEVRRPGPALQTLTPDSGGVLEVPITGGMTQVAVLPPRAATAIHSATEYLAVGEYYESRGEFGRALREYERLEQQYAGTEVAHQAATKRAGLLQQSGVVIVANQSRVPLEVRYLGPSSTAGTVEPGESQAFVVRAGQYREVFQPGSSMMLAVATPEPELLTVAQGEAVVREYGIPLLAQPEVYDPDANLRGRLSEAEKTALVARAKAMLPAPPAPAEEAADGEETLTGPELNIVAEKKVVTPQKETGKTEFNIRNLTSHPIEITVTHYVVGVRPETATMELKPRGRVALEFSEPGTYDVGGLVLTNHQRIVFGQYGNDGQKYYFDIDELSEKDLARREKEKRRKLFKGAR